MGFIKMKKAVFALLFCLFIMCCRSRGPHNKVWESKHHPSDELRKEYNQLNKKATKDYKNSKKRFKRSHK